jgi:UDP-N-acetylmuramate dehydrogenase
MNFNDKVLSVTNDKVLLDEPLKNYTTFGIGGGARYFVKPSGIESFIKIIRLTKEFNLNLFILGKGSNLLISDGGFDGVVVYTKNLNRIIKTGDYIYAESGVTVAELLSFCVKNNLGGIEFLAGIPATVGGLIATGAGAFDKNFTNFLSQVAVLDNGDAKLINITDFYGYRESVVKKEQAVLFAVIRCVKSETVRQDILEYLKKRKNLPRGKSCGSIFKNPKNYYAGQLIDLANLKGIKIGGAEISPKHANFIINTGDAKASEVYALIQKAKLEVKQKFGVELIEEVRLVGDF